MTGFEELRYADGIYSMKFNRSQKNIRILFAFLDNNCALLLSAFEEKNNKKTSQDSYKKHIPLAQKRLKEVIADD
ncbi:MAG TPA: type II toxin-antitoxin system RelE/ParE family toxin [Syntrophomonadaceae bacterium]|nr:type II toxin-antitoxin system RelE/ParE family toxin [Syntrophomonadaceae bacterium]